MRADAPGKLVLSGAYAVLRGAPAIVSAVDRRVVCDTSRPATYRAREVEEGIRLLKKARELPFYDASPLRSSLDKLGLGSSAAICVACLGALLAEEDPKLRGGALKKQLYLLARAAHRNAQGGGSGLDVAAACFGGTMSAQLDLRNPQAPPEVKPLTIPADLSIEVWGSRDSASTSEFVRRVFEREKTHPSEFNSILTVQHQASVAALDAVRTGDSKSFIAALWAQASALRQLGDLAGLPIVPQHLAEMMEQLSDDSALLPSGAGGGDISLYVGPRPSSNKFRERAIQEGLFLVPLALDAEGFRLLDS